MRFTAQRAFQKPDSSRTEGLATIGADAYLHVAARARLLAVSRFRLHYFEE